MDQSFRGLRKEKFYLVRDMFKTDLVDSVKKAVRPENTDLAVIP